MELLQVLHKNIPQRKKVFALFHKRHKQDISKFLLHMIKNIKKENKNIKMMNAFCIEIYDTLHYYIMFDKVKINKKMLRLLEELALPMNYIGEEQRKETLKKIVKIKI